VLAGCCRRASSTSAMITLLPSRAGAKPADTEAHRQGRDREVGDEDASLRGRGGGLAAVWRRRRCAQPCTGLSLPTLHELALTPMQNSEVALVFALKSKLGTQQPMQ